MAGMLIDFEGIDASGKGTQARILAEHLQGKGMRVVLTREPFIELPALASIISGAGVIRTHKDEETLSGIGKYKLAKQTDALLFAADRSEHVDKVVKPAIAEGKTVITDRYYPSSIAYQSGIDGLEEAWVRAINNFSPKPDAIILLDIDPKQALDRVAGHANRRLSRFEVPDKQVKVREKYLEMSRNEKWIVIDGAMTVQKVSQAIIAALIVRGILRA